jgi:SOS-response transcriptional repressor LexA
VGRIGAPIPTALHNPAARRRRVHHSEPPKIVIKLINPEYQTYERDAEEVNIIGRVISAPKRL